MSATNCHSDYRRCMTKNYSHSFDSHFQDWEGNVCLFCLNMKVAKVLKKDNDVPKSICCDKQYDIWVRPSIELRDNTNRWLEPMGLAKPGNTRGLMSPQLGFVRQEAAGEDFELVWNGTDTFLWSQPRLLAGYPDLLRTLYSIYKSLNQLHMNLGYSWRFTWRLD